MTVLKSIPSLIKYNCIFTTNLETTTLKERIRDIFLRRRQWHGAEIYLLIVLFVFGVTSSFILPLGAGYDEETHLMRIWEMSHLTLVPNEELGAKLPFPAIYWELSYRRQLLVRPIEEGFWEKFGHLPIDSMDYIYKGVETRSVYSPPLLLPQALIMRLLGLNLQLPAIPVYHALRITGLLSYMILAWLAVRWIPHGKWILAILASSPVAIGQASLISTDAISNGLALLFIGGSLAIANQKVLGWREWGLLSLLLALLFWGKLNVVPLAILPFLMLRPSQFKMKHGYFTLLLMALVLGAVEVGGWSAIAYSRLSTPPEGTNPIGQVQFVLTQPITFTTILARTIWSSSFNYLLDWIAIYGFAYWPVPVGTYILYATAVLASLFIRDTGMDGKTRLALLITFVVSYAATFTIMYVTFNPVGSDTIAGVQGRYFITVMPLLFLAATGLPFTNRINIPAHLPAFFVSLSLALFLAGMYLSYHVTCGSQFYKTGLCYQPIYKNWAPDAQYSEPISDQFSLRQEIVLECNGATQVRVWVNAADADPQGYTEFILKDMNVGRNILQNSVLNSDLPSGSWYSMDFPADWQSRDKFYLLTIRAGGLTRGPQIAYSLKPEYTPGKLYENETALNKDMIFQWGCVAGLEKLTQK